VEPQHPNKNFVGLDFDGKDVKDKDAKQGSSSSSRPMISCIADGLFASFAFSDSQ